MYVCKYAAHLGAQPTRSHLGLSLSFGWSAYLVCCCKYVPCMSESVDRVVQSDGLTFCSTRSPKGPKSSIHDILCRRSPPLPITAGYVWLVYPLRQLLIGQLGHNAQNPTLQCCTRVQLVHPLSWRTHDAHHRKDRATGWRHGKAAAEFCTRDLLHRDKKACADRDMVTT